MKNQNFPILLVVIAVVAVLAQFARNRGPNPELESLRQDMSVSLSRLWNKENQQVDLTATGQRVDVRANVSMPDNLRVRVKRWNYPLLRFVAAHHPALQVQNLEVHESGNQQAIPEYAMNGLLAERAYRSPGPGEQEEQFCQMTTRQWTTALDAKFGSGHTLVLVDAQEARSARDQVYGRRAAGAVPAPSYPRFLVNEICLVADGQVPADGLARFQQDNPAVRWRLVNLPI